MSYLVFVFGLFLLGLGAVLAYFGLWGWQDWQYTVLGTNLFAGGAVVMALAAVVTRLDALISTLRNSAGIAQPVVAPHIAPAPSMPVDRVAALGVSAVSETLADHLEQVRQTTPRPEPDAPVHETSDDQAELPIFDATPVEPPVVASAPIRPVVAPLLHEAAKVETLDVPEPERAPVSEVETTEPITAEVAKPTAQPFFGRAEHPAAPMKEETPAPQPDMQIDPVMPPIAPPEPAPRPEAPPVIDFDADPAKMDWLDRALAGVDEAPPPPLAMSSASLETVAPQPEPEQEPEPSVVSLEEEASESHEPPAPAKSTPKEDPAAPAHRASEPAVIGRYDAHGNTYVLYADGSIDAETPNGTFRFKSMAELKEFIEETIT